MTVYNFLLEIKNIIQKRFIIIILISVILSVLVGMYYRSFPKIYVASSKIFPLSATSAQGTSSPLDAIKSQFGIATTSPTDVYDILELSRSKKLAYKVVNAAPTSNKKYAKIYNWIADERNKNLSYFESPIVLSNKKEDSLKNLIFGRGSILPAIEVIKGENGYTTLNTRSTDPLLARELNEKILTALSNFYVEFVTEKARQDITQIQFMRDSLYVELLNIDKGIASTTDQSAYATSATVALPAQKLGRRKVEVEALYGTTVTALQNARFKLLSQSPIFQILDNPDEPYITDPNPWKTYTVVSFIFFTILLCFWFSRKLIFNLIIEELKKV